MTDPRNTTAPETGRPAPVVFRAVPSVSLVAVAFGVLGLSPIAFQGGAWWFVLLVPLAVAAWVLRTRTVADADGLRVLQLWGRRTLAWSSVETLRLVERGWVRAVRTDGGEDPLVGIRVRDLGRLGTASGGRIRVPTPAEAEAAAEHERELTAARMRIERLREQQEEEDARIAAHADAVGDGGVEAAGDGGTDGPAPGDGPTVGVNSEDENGDGSAGTAAPADGGTDRSPGAAEAAPERGRDA